MSELASSYDMSFAAVQKHVAVLEAAHLIVKRAEGRERLVRADPAMIARARALLLSLLACGPVAAGAPSGPTTAATAIPAWAPPCPSAG